MNTISFSNAFKSLMATLGAKTTDSNYAVPLVNKTSGAPQGFMDMSNLESVLGDYGTKNKVICNESFNVDEKKTFTVNGYIGLYLVKNENTGHFVLFLRRYQVITEIISNLPDKIMIESSEGIPNTISITNKHTVTASIKLIQIAS